MIWREKSVQERRARPLLATKAAILTAAICLSAVLAPAPGFAQSASDPGYLDSRQRAEQDWEAFSQSASSLWEQTSDALVPVFSNPAVAVATLSAALLGGLFGAWARGAPTPSPAPPDRPARRRRRPERPERAAGMIFRPEREAQHDGERDDARERDIPRAPRKPDLAASEANRLFRFFEERFGLTDRSASAAIDFFTKLSQSIDSLRRRAEDAEAECDRLASRGAGAVAAQEARRTAEASQDDPNAPAWSLISDGMRLCRSALQQHGASDPEFARFESVVEFEEMLLGLSEARAAALHSGQGLEANAIEQSWPHAVFRAEALLQTYYPGQGPWGDLREAVSLMAGPLRQLFRAAGVTVASATLLAPFSDKDGERWSDAAEDLTELQQVRERLQGAVERERRAFVIDCETFGYRDARRGLSARSRLILLDPEEWE